MIVGRAPVRTTPAQRRALGKACASGGSGSVRRSERPLEAIQDPAWDNPHVIDRLVAKGLLRPGDGFNTFVATERGATIYQRRQERQSRSKV